MDTEEKLHIKIKSAQADGDFDLVQELMSKLIKIQKEIPIPETEEKLLVRAGVNMLIYQQEKQVREQIKRAEQDGDFTTVRELSRELIRLQKRQPSVRKAVRMYE